MNVLFLGLMYNSSEEKSLIKLSKTGLGIASNILEGNLIRGLQQQKNDIQTITSLPVGNFPEANKKIYYPSKRYIISDFISSYETYTINLPIIKHELRFIEYKIQINKWYEKMDKETDKIIIIYDLYIPFLKIIKWMKDTYENVKIVVMIPDLVGKYRNNSIKSKTKRNLLERKVDKTFELMNQADGYLLITEQISRFIEDENKPRMVIDGIVDDKNVKFKITNNKQTIFMYSGLLSSQYNVDKLIDIFLNLEENQAQLWLCGYGELEAKLKKIESTNIKFYGLIPKKEVSDLEYQADVLINPRSNKGEYTKYSFPSKNLEYLLKGKPVICYKLDGISNDYEEVFDYVEETAQGLESKIQKYINMNIEEIRTLGKRNQDFVIRHNGVEPQGAKINKFLEECFK